MRTFQTYWYDIRFRARLFQAILIAAVGASLFWLVHNTQVNLASRGMNIDFGFLAQTARFPISESLIAYAPTDSFARAFVVGLINTLLVSGLAICLATVTGFFLALARRSSHPLLSGGARVYIEIIRNTPLVVHLLFWYLLLITALPNARQAIEPLPNVYVTIRGIFVPKIAIEGGGWFLFAVLVVLALGLSSLLLPRLRRLARSGGPVGVAAVVVAILAVFATWWVSQGLAIKAEIPQLRGLNFRGGLQVTPEFVALVLGLVIYKTAFIAEIFRGGINAVHRGQWEAARALGLKERDTLRGIVLPQALRIIVPPMASQYLTAVKNTTIALAIGFPDLSGIVGTVINQSGRALEGFTVMIAIYLVISISVAGFMNWYNARVALKGGK